ncbi:hypothetical protein CCP3SC15_4780002 [Gammaproteobacteria bacterium]
MKNLHKRGSVWYLVAQVNGERLSQSLDTGDQEEAAKIARGILKEARAGRWAELKDKVALRRTKALATIGEVVKAYRTEAAIQELREGSPRPATVDANVRMLHLVVGSDREDVCTSVLTRQRAEDFCDKMLADGDGDAIDRKRARESAYSSLNQAKSVFARWARDAYAKAGLVLPDLHEFLEAIPVKRPKRNYKWPGDEFVNGTEQKALDLKGKPLRAAWLLCHDLGMRAGEAEMACWDWIVVENGAAYMVICERPGFRPKSRDHKVRIPAATLQELMALKRKNDPYILEGGRPTYRRDLVQRDLAAWMRDNGWDAHRFPKGAHELRKLAGSRWYTRHGLEVAAEWLGDNPSTVFKFYADLERHPDPVAEVPGRTLGVAG